MRKLTSKQKKLLDREISVNHIKNADDLSGGAWSELKKINDTEILWQEVNRYIMDKFFQNLNN